MLKSVAISSQEDISVPNLKDMTIIRNEQKDLNIKPVHKVNTRFETATFGMGCFWGAESLYGAKKGVIRTTVGYAGGTTIGPKYRDLGDHTEVLEIDYDPTVVTFKDLLQLFWNNHEYGLCTKIKRQYMSLILYHNEEQRRISEESKNEEQKNRKPEVIRTEINEKKNFYAAEDYHQKYRLQGHKDLCESIGISSNSSELLQNSYIATKLNGYLVGVGGVQQFLDDVDTLGITPSQKQYVRHYCEQNEGTGLFC